MNITKDINNIVRYEERLNRINGYEYQNMKKMKNIIQKINEYYSKGIPADYLIKRLSKLDFILNKFDTLMVSIFLGVATSLFVSLILHLSSFLEFSSSWIGVLISDVIFIIVFVIPIEIIFFGVAIFIAIRLFTKHENLLICKYEKEVILKKLKSEYQLDFNV